MRHYPADPRSPHDSLRGVRRQLATAQSATPESAYPPSAEKGANDPWSSAVTRLQFIRGQPAKHYRDRPCHVDRPLHVVVDVAEPEQHLHLVGADLLEPRSGEQRAGPLLARHAEDAGSPRLRRRQVAALDEDACGDRGPCVPLGSAPDRHREPPARSEARGESLRAPPRRRPSACSRSGRPRRRPTRRRGRSARHPSRGIRRSRLRAARRTGGRPRPCPARSRSRSAGPSSPMIPATVKPRSPVPLASSSTAFAGSRRELPDQPVVYRCDGFAEMHPPALPAGSHDFPGPQARLTVLLRLHHRQS